MKTRGRLSREPTSWRGEAAGLSCVEGCSAAQLKMAGSQLEKEGRKSKEKKNGSGDETSALLLRCTRLPSRTLMKAPGLQEPSDRFRLSRRPSLNG